MPLASHVVTQMEAGEAVETVSGPFGGPEGAWGDLNHVIQFPAQDFPGLGRNPHNSEIRVVAGALGSGKSLFLRRMQAHQKDDNKRAVYAPEIQRSSDLRTEHVVKFTNSIGAPTGNSELWKLLWRRAIFRSLATHMRINLSPYLPVDAKDFFARYSDMLGAPDRDERTVVHEVKELIDSASTGRQYRLRLDNDRWANIEKYMSRLLAEMPPVFLYLDEIDKEYKSSPSAWTLCQKGLVYTIMDLQRESDFQGRLHLIAAVRDTTIVSISAGEHAQRLLDPQYCNLMNWSRQAASYFLARKVERLPDEYFRTSGEAKTVSNWLGMDSITNARPSQDVESISDYLLRHTGLVARDIIRLGNRLCAEIKRSGSLSPEDIRGIVGEQAAGFAEKLLSVVANQALGESMPASWWRRGTRLRIADLSWGRDAVLECIEATGSERLSREQIEELDRTATARFAEYLDRPKLKLSDVLWQNRLLAAVSSDGRFRYFNLDEALSSLALPRVGGIDYYAWNPLLHDVTPSLSIDLDSALWPR